MTEQKTEFRVWAPKPARVRLDVEGRPHAMSRTDDGWWHAAVACAPDARYGFLLDDDPTVLPDPRSPRQPEGVHARSQLWDPAAATWTDSAWPGRSTHGAVIYELHLGTFTAAGTFDSAIEKLDYLVDLGVDFVELMPVNSFAGTRGWGYDGVLWYSVHEPYGGPDGLVRFVDACHARGLGVLIDAVFNHLGPSGNYLPRFGPYLSSASNPWGEGINIADADSDEVRRYIIGCALRWMRDFHADGLRLDAVHALVDTTAIHILEELATETDWLATQLGRPLSLIAESDLNDPRLITARERGGYGLTAQWADDIHHAIHTAVSGERQGYYADFGSIATLAHTLRHGYFHAATYSSFRRRRHGRPLDTSAQTGIPATRLLAYTCTHDQVGNRALGDRPSQNLTAGQLAVKAVLALLSPYTAMLFMGEEYGASTPFQFFSSHPEPELARATAEGRKTEFAEHGWDASKKGEIPDPQDPQTFARSKLNWDEVGTGEHARLHRLYRDLIALRHNDPDLADPWLEHLTVDYDEDQRWIVLARGRLRIVCNLGAEPVTVPVGGELMLAWDEPTVDADTTALQGHSFAILSTPGQPVDN
ncbi:MULTISPECIES: malto-oligosyltrehalose trehalohydrolase [Mycobacterium avium complex (MAC)]|uniref:Malto-oligosyltrehalose trehalohydrolase n=5 Tax=Mycobacterium avium complex (MAC) TaxID=120793 RepID=A0AAW5S8I5_MYCBC|nr:MULTISPECIES: malto-oligosyltrehalose trehalohydrolase [Mycobacterium avium complex (MAC)]TXA41164.1 malto-oligosyltrehalose trehalohydrolase [Mycobacterium tuberculosis variant bovis]ABK68344.1 malto-oligosyltrehalose trehalohydrolase [Mycobacterium avium 104]APT11623.1 malto-oligosyltrehalose trehalohydrolase [Mycobacterium avium subsp. hominissuis]ETZ35321.1 malto-oligosyltrehalose trehalohydrolase [Mycobacterium avium MAV_120809_2495]ETZ51064.1 malto-oligosyltrehalose trehalohydrolase [